eukprot:TRINITY_DN9177_c0_g1_i1.p1 TRINITY_DN9177_c0_g1~~TRINITY_DN9177_c0_g1_i1.p1  ORF type:complete len:264 (+),score=37.31 TRINITY_DN9177_c0_g1_i1:45-836(+)
MFPRGVISLYLARLCVIILVVVAVVLSCAGGSDASTPAFIKSLPSGELRFTCTNATFAGDVAVGSASLLKVNTKLNALETRVIRNIPRDEVNLLAYGAAADGVNDDAWAFNSALDAIRTTGGTLYIPAGQYLLKGQVWMDMEALSGKIEIRGDGVSTVLLWTFDEDAPSHLFAFSSGGSASQIPIHIHDLKIFVTDYLFGYSVFDFSATLYVYMHDVTINANDIPLEIIKAQEGKDYVFERLLVTYIGTYSTVFSMTEIENVI